MRRFLCALVFLPLTTISPQEPAAPQKLQGSTLSGSVNPDRKIDLEVQVTDKAGSAARGLQPKDLVVLDDKQPRELLSFREVDGAAADIEIVLVVDEVNASFSQVSFERSQLKTFLLANDGKLPQPVRLVIFSDSDTVVQQSPTRNGKDLVALYDQHITRLRYLTRSQGFFGAAERYDLSLKTLTSLVAYEKTRPGRKLMIWFSPGWPFLSGPGVELTRKEGEQLFHSIVAQSTAMREANVTLYSIDPIGAVEAGTLRTSYYEQFVKGIASPGQVQPANLSLQVLAVQSGGRVFNASNDLIAAMAACVDDAKSFYSISFEAARADQPNEYHTLTVKVDKPGLKVRTRSGYYAHP